MISAVGVCAAVVTTLVQAATLCTALQTQSQTADTASATEDGTLEMFR